MKLSVPLQLVSWVLQIAAAVILLQTLFFKFTGAPESVYIFSRLGAEPWGRIGSGVAELIVALLLLHPKTAVYGGIGAVIIMTGAVGAHLTVLGISIENDGGLLFGLALGVLVSGVALIVLHRHALPVFGGMFGSTMPIR